MAMAEARNKILTRMLERLFAGLVSGPNLNCRPHASRQRIDFTQLERLRDVTPSDALQRLLGDERAVKLTGSLPAPKKLKKVEKKARGKSVPKLEPEKPPEEDWTPEEKAAFLAWNEQQGSLGKLRIVAEEARTYEQDTGAHVLNVGFPLLSLPPGTFSSSGGRAASRRVLAPIAFLPVTLTLRPGTTPVVEIACMSDGIDAVIPNTALLAWLEQQTGTMPEVPTTSEEISLEPLAVISALVRQTAALLKLPIPDLFSDKPVAEGEQRTLQLQPAPRADDEDAAARIVPAAVLGLFPMNNQGLLRDMQSLAAAETLTGPLQSFVQAGLSLDQAVDRSYEHDAWAGSTRRPRLFAEERLVSPCDPCQTRAVRLARTSAGLVIHGPPGTGKSQTITNIIGDHLSRGERVLMVCDKRTALDVVANRLRHLGLGQLCALIHDPQRDQHELYRSIREHLESLTEARSDARAEQKLERLDAELQRLHNELTEYWLLLMEKEPKSGLSFHDLMGQWLSVPAPDEVRVDASKLKGITVQQLEQHEQDLRDLLARAQRSQMGTSPWTAAAGIGLAEFLAAPMDELRERLTACVAAAERAEATLDKAIPSFTAEPALQTQAQARREIAEQLAFVLEQGDSAVLRRWAKQDADGLRRARQRLTEAEGNLQAVRTRPLDTELEILARTERPGAATVAQQLGVLENYLQVARRWYVVFAWKRTDQAAQVLNRYGLPASDESALRLREFLLGLRNRIVLQTLYNELVADTGKKDLPEDDVLQKSLAVLATLFDLLLRVHTDPALQGLVEPVRKALTEKSGKTLIEGLRKSADWAAALTNLQEALTRSRLFSPAWIDQAMTTYRSGRTATKQIRELESSFDTLEAILRVRGGLARLPAGLQQAVTPLLETKVEVEDALAAVHRAAFAAVIAERLREHPRLQTQDAHQLQSNLERYSQLEAEKQALVGQVVLHRWLTRQKDRLLVGTGSRLNSLGADVRRRLTMRGERALRLRQVIAIGQGIEGGDPLFDLCPVWMASPETVAQIFPREPLFDVIIFDEASQCRLEEALPVLPRAKRVVIAGDPKQLPPTRFFESAITVSEDEAIEDQQQLFEVQQGEIEDLLNAALNIDIQQCYLDVHYRSRNADLIEFSNEQFYSSRLQPIPGHPSNRSRFAPITLYRAEGTYEERRNPTEAEQVCKIVRDLLRRAEPPSIGIACFNLAQRDLIAQKLDDLAQEDRDFGKRLAEAWVRRGAGSFEGLFVKNLENVQGDERDHIIISTTYGPDAEGRFYRRFGPLGRAGGGRRLNVLVTRAREEVHLVTSIPAQVYRALPPVPQGQAPSGAWLLFAYLSYAEQLAEAYEAIHQAENEPTPKRRLLVNVRPSRTPSAFAEALANRLADRHQVGSDVHWGNDGFCVDLALHHPRQADQVTIGVLCDGARFAQAEDPVEWDVFRTTVLQQQGWKLHRLWTPHFFRDPGTGTKGILKDVQQWLAGEQEKDTIRVADRREK